MICGLRTFGVKYTDVVGNTDKKNELNYRNRLNELLSNINEL